MATLPGAENDGKPGYYTVKPGDTLIRIGLDSGQNWRDINRWNNIDNPNQIEVGQVLRVSPPAGDVAAAKSRLDSLGKDAKYKLDGDGRLDLVFTQGQPLEAAAAAEAAAADAAAANTGGLRIYLNTTALGGAPGGAPQPVQPGMQAGIPQGMRNPTQAQQMPQQGMPA
jgi:lipoprotein NlpD